MIEALCRLKLDARPDQMGDILALQDEIARLRGYESAAGILAVEKAQLRRENERLGADFNAARDSLDRQIAHTQTIADEQYRLRSQVGELAAALRAVLDTTGVRHMLAGLAKGVGTAHPDGIALKAAEVVLAKLEATP